MINIKIRVKLLHIEVISKYIIYALQIQFNNNLKFNFLFDNNNKIEFVNLQLIKNEKND